MKKLVPYLCLKLKPEGWVSLIKLDEILHNLHSKKQTLDLESLLSAYSACLRENDISTLRRLLIRLSKWKSLFYFTNRLEFYKSLIPANRFFQGKDGTHSIEQTMGLNVTGLYVSSANPS